VNVPESGRRIFICLNNGSAVFSNPIIKLSTSPFPGPLEIKDFNNDGKLDLATGHRLSIDIHLGLGNGDFMQSVPYATDPSTFDLCVSDFNNDGKFDIASSHLSDSASINVMFGNGDGTFQPIQYYYAPGSMDLQNSRGITAGDVNNDGFKDIILANGVSHTMSIM